MLLHEPKLKHSFLPSNKAIRRVTAPKENIGCVLGYTGHWVLTVAAVDGCGPSNKRCNTVSCLSASSFIDMIPRLLWRVVPSEQVLCSVVAASTRLIRDGVAPNLLFNHLPLTFDGCRRHATAAGQGSQSSSSSTMQGAATSGKPDVPKCTNPSATPHSQAIALMLSKDQMPEEQLRSSMDALSQQLLQNIGSYSSTELSAFTEACR
jgi:hypothetical protein